MGTVRAQIESYCADFQVNPPYASAVTATYYRRNHPTINGAYKYIFYTVGSASLTEIDEPIEIAQPPALSRFNIGLTWDDSLSTSSYVQGNKIYTPMDLRLVDGISPARIVVEYDDMTDLLTLKFDATQNLRSITDSNIPASNTRTYYKTTVAPRTIERGTSLVYFVNEDDDNSSIVSKTTPMRFFTLFNNNLNQAFEIDLFTPQVTEGMVKQTAFRINKITSLDPTIGSVSYSLDVFGKNSVSAAPPTQSAGGSDWNLQNVHLVPGYAIDTITGSGTTSTSFHGTVITLLNGNRYVAVQNVFDKSINELFGDFSMGLFKLYTNDEETNMYLGIESSSLVIKDYFRFTNHPAYSCQFRMYDIGGNQFMLVINGNYVRVTDAGNISITTTQPTQKETGWSIERVDPTINLVSLKWNYPGELASRPTNKYLRIEGTTVTIDPLSANANIFVCYKCSYLDPITGTCMSLTNQYIDDDMNSSTVPKIASPMGLRDARDAPVMTIRNVSIFLQSSPPDMSLKVSNDGTIRFDSNTPADKLFFTKTGMTTSQKNTQNLYFIGKMTYSSKILYAKWSTTAAEFVYATRPNVEDGFGWIIGQDTIQPSSTSGITNPFDLFYDNPGAVANGTRYSFYYGMRVSVGAYNMEGDFFPLTVTFTPTITTSSIKVYITAVDYGGLPLASSVFNGSFTADIDHTVTYNFSAWDYGLSPEISIQTGNDPDNNPNEILGPIRNVNIPARPAPVIVTNPVITPEITGIRISGANVRDATDDVSVVTTLTSSSVVVSLAADISSGNSVFVDLGLLPSRTYSSGYSIVFSNRSKTTTYIIPTFTTKAPFFINTLPAPFYNFNNDEWAYSFTFLSPSNIRIQSSPTGSSSWTNIKTTTYQGSSLNQQVTFSETIPAGTAYIRAVRVDNNAVVGPLSIDTRSLFARQAPVVTITPTMQIISAISVRFHSAVVSNLSYVEIKNGASQLFKGGDITSPQGVVTNPQYMNPGGTYNLTIVYSNRDTSNTSLSIPQFTTPQLTFTGSVAVSTSGVFTITPGTTISNFDNPDPVVRIAFGLTTQSTTWSVLSSATGYAFTGLIPGTTYTVTGITLIDNYGNSPRDTISFSPSSFTVPSISFHERITTSSNVFILKQSSNYITLDPLASPVENTKLGIAASLANATRFIIDRNPLRIRMYSFGGGSKPPPQDVYYLERRSSDSLVYINNRGTPMTNTNYQWTISDASSAPPTINIRNIGSQGGLSLTSGKLYSQTGTSPIGFELVVLSAEYLHSSSTAFLLRDTTANRNYIKHGAGAGAPPISGSTRMWQESNKNNGEVCKFIMETSSVSGWYTMRIHTIGSTQQSTNYYLRRGSGDWIYITTTRSPASDSDLWKFENNGNGQVVLKNKDGSGGSRDIVWDNSDSGIFRLRSVTPAGSSSPINFDIEF